MTAVFHFVPLRGIDAICAVLIFAGLGCDSGERISGLEKQNQDLQAEIKKRDAVAVYDMQEKCARSAKVWFSENWGSSGSDKDTILLDRTNHYNKSNNKCFVLVEYHYATDRSTGSWVNHISLWDANENLSTEKCRNCIPCIRSLTFTSKIK